MNTRVVLVYWPHATWKTVSRLLDAGRMPNLHRLVEDGVVGKLDPLIPGFGDSMYASAITGVRADRHGILTPFDVDQRTGRLCRPLSTNLCSKPVWRILAEAGQRTVVVGCPLVYPVTEHSQGAAVAREIFAGMNYRGQPWAPTPHSAAAEEAFNLTQLCLRPEELSADELIPFLPDLASIEQKRDPIAWNLATELSQVTSLHAIATSRMKAGDWRFAATAPTLIQSAHTRLRRTEEHLQRTVIETAYQFSDQMLGRMIEIAGTQALTIVFSEGWICLAGAGTRKDVWLHGMNALHIAPTVLYALDCPVPRAVECPPLITAFENPGSVSWSDEPIDIGEAKHTNENWLAELKAQGYSDPAEEEWRNNTLRLERQRAFNLADLYLTTNRVTTSLEIVEDWVSSHQDDADAVLRLCYTTFLAARLEECERILSTIPDADHTRAIVTCVRAGMALRQGQEDAARPLLLETEAQNPGKLPLLSYAIGCLYLDLQDYESAERVFSYAATRFSDCWPLHEGLAKALQARGRLAEAAEAQRHGLTTGFVSPESHTRLAFLLLGLGKHAQAAQAFRIAAALT